MYYYDKAGCFTAIDVLDKELNVFPHKIAKYNKFGKLVSVAFVVQGFALCSFAFQNDEESVITGLPRRFTPRNDEVLD